MSDPVAVALRAADLLDVFGPCYRYARSSTSMSAPSREPFANVRV